MRIPSLALAVALALPAAAQDIRDASDAPRAEAGAYLAARAAGRVADFAAAGPLWERALRGDPANPALLENALGADLGLGRFEAAEARAAAMVEAGAGAPLAHMTLAAGRARRGDWDAVLAGLEAGQTGGPLVDGLGRAWAEVGLGDRDAALAAFDEVAIAPGLGPVGRYHEALALAALGDLAGAEAVLAGEAEAGVRARPGVLAQAALLGALGRAPEGVAAIDALGAGADPALSALRDRLAAGEATPFAMTPARGLAEAHANIAASLDGVGDAAAALMHARLALALDPGHVDAALTAAARLETLGRPDLAGAAYALVPADDPSWPTAEMGRAATLREAGDGEAALGVLAALAAARPDLAEAQAAHGDQLRRLERPGEAEAAYDRAVALMGEDDAALWFVHFARARAREAQGDWPGAEADLRRALDLDPGQPQVLNHLGYSLVERGEALEEALGMIEAAVARRPDSGAIVDSLGWARFRLGDLPEAVTLLERAVALEPADAVVNDHLGDAYWAVGRSREARFQWRRALAFDPTPEAAALIRAKIERGLVAAPEGPGDG